MNAPTRTITSYYAPYRGHDVAHLATVLQELRKQHGSITFLAGDSSLDNKYWFDEWAPARNGYEHVLRPQVMKKDVCYWMNDDTGRRGTGTDSASSVGCLNTAVEATSLDDRACGRLTPQDVFLRDNMTSDDTLIVSVGGNDVALAPTVCTAINMGLLTRCAPGWCFGRESGRDTTGYGGRGGKTKNKSSICPLVCCAPNLYKLFGDCGRPGCGVTGCVAGTCSCPCGFGYVVDLFGSRVENYVNRLCEKTKPTKVLICTIYHPLEKVKGATPSWADAALTALGYDAEPDKTQRVIRAIHDRATCGIKIKGVSNVGTALVLSQTQAPTFAQTRP